MPLLTEERAIKEYFEEVKHKYPEVSFDEFAEVCKAPGAFIKFCIKAGNLPVILVKHIGKFRVFPSRLKEQIKSEERFREKGITTQEEYETKVTFYKKYLNELTKDYDKGDNDDCNGEETTD